MDSAFSRLDREYIIQSANENAALTNEEYLILCDATFHPLIAVFLVPDLPHGACFLFRFPVDVPGDMIQHCAPTACSV